MTTKEISEHSRIDKLEVRMDNIEKAFYESKINQVKDYAELEKVIAKAVKEGNQVIIEEMRKAQELQDKRFSEQDKRIKALELSDGEKAKEKLKLIITTTITTTIGWLILGILNNLGLFIGK